MYKNLSLGALGHPGQPFDVAVDIAKRHGFAGIDLDLTFLAAMAKGRGLSTAQAWFAGSGLRAGGFGLSAAWRESDSDSAFEESLTKLSADAALAQALGCTRCTTWVMPRSAQLDFYQHFDLVVPRLTRAANILGQHGVSLGLEFVGPQTIRAGHPHDFVHTMDGMRTFAAAIGMTAKNTGLLLDAFHWWTSHGTQTELEHLKADEIVCVHLNDAVAGRDRDAQIDNQREQVGATGVIPIRDFMHTLRKLGYAGPLTVEPFNAALKAMTPDAAAAATSAALDRVLSL